MLRRTIAVAVLRHARRKRTLTDATARTLSQVSGALHCSIGSCRQLDFLREWCVVVSFLSGSVHVSTDPVVCVTLLFLSQPSLATFAKVRRISCYFGFCFFLTKKHFFIMYYILLFYVIILTLFFHNYFSRVSKLRCSRFKYCLHSPAASRQRRVLLGPPDSGRPPLRPHPGRRGARLSDVRRARGGAQGRGR